MGARRLGAGGGHIYVSPHLDDAVLSCGGWIRANRQRGEPVTVLTLCGGRPEGHALSPLAARYHQAWRERGNAPEQRLQENAAVLAAMDAGHRECATPDAIYRRGEEGPYYMERADLFREQDARDAAAVLPLWESEVRRLATDRRAGTLFFPLAVGGHVDHELARRLGERLAGDGFRVAFYEDYPYAELEPGGVRRAQARFGPGVWEPETVRIDAAAKIDAVRGYRTQIGPVFGSEADLARRIRESSAEVACAFDGAERLRRRLAPSGVRRALWRKAFGWHAHAERVWTFSQERAAAWLGSGQRIPGAAE
ncbi:MAG: hypothetical protein B7Z68_02700 [Acidobacteria bacterium 21-70-11]|nr:MAG: hypothetical protein B7Z68_02700 [Acidobacteria bacterium 21-70-11]HQU33375.1 PIG-L family deacetylase [Thermoanaerobaculaceae bacterium]